MIICFFSLHFQLVSFLFYFSSEAHIVYTNIFSYANFVQYLPIRTVFVMFEKDERLLENVYKRTLPFTTYSNSPTLMLAISIFSLLTFYVNLVLTAWP